MRFEWHGRVRHSHGTIEPFEPARIVQHLRSATPSIDDENIRRIVELVVEEIQRRAREEITPQEIREIVLAKLKQD
jgi:transcriptional regulator NrdR family protein